jgi:hypothetical protein
MDATLSAGFSGRPYTQHLRVYSASDDTANNRSAYGFQFYCTSNSGYGSFATDSFPWSIQVGSYTQSGSSSLDFRPDSAGKALYQASGTTGYMTHDGNGNLNFTVAFTWNGVSVFGNASGSTTMSGDRLPQAPGAPGTPTFSALAPTSATVAYTAASRGHADIDAYSLHYSTDPTFATETVLANTASLSQNVSGLTPGTTYYWRVNAHNGDGWGAFSASGSFTTLSGFYVWSGTDWRPTTVYTWDGTQWKVATVYTYKSGAWTLAC